MDVVLSIRGLFARYDRGDVLRGVDLDVERGGVTCVIGPNGAGKSTVLKVVSGLLRPRAGDVALDGERISGRSARQILDHGVGSVPGEGSLFPSMSGWDFDGIGGLRISRAG